MIRKPTIEDTVRTAEIHVYGWRNAYAGIIPDEELYNNRNVEKAIISHKNIIENNPEIFDIYDDGIVKGIILHSDSRDEGSEDCYELFAIYVEPSFIGNGIGTKLLSYVERRGREKAKRKIVLWVLENNKKGIEFYKKNGYLFDGSTKYVKEWDQKETRLSKPL